MSTLSTLISTAARWLLRTLSDPRVWGRLCIALCVAIGLWILVARVRRAGDLAPGIVLAVPHLIELTFLAVGAWMLGHGWPRREGATEHCAACGFEHIRAEHRLLPTCPECGKPWAYFGGLATGKPIQHMPLMIAGAASIGIALGFVSIRVFAPSIFLRPVPTQMLIQHATQLPGYDPQGENAWIELGNRTLTGAERRDIAVALLDRRLRQRWLPSRASEWLRIAVDSGVGGEEVGRRYREEMVSLSLELPQSTPPDTLITYNLNALVRGYPPTGGIALYIEGVWIENGPIVMGNRDGRITFPSSGTSKLEDGYIPPLDVGEYTLTLKGWIVAFDHAGTEPLVWSGDQRPILAPQVEWSQPVVLRQTFKVARPEPKP